MIAISTAYKEALIGIEINGKISTFSLDSNCKHSENILFSIDQMLDKMGANLSENESYAVVIGPGSFTGIRIGISLLKGLLAGKKDKSVVALTTFDLMAYSYIKNFAPTKNFTCIINGLSGYYFICQYSPQGAKLSEEKMITKEDLDALQTDIIGLGEEGLGNVQTTPTAQQLLILAKEMEAKNQTISVKHLIPMYLRKSQAESGLEGKK